MKSRLLRFFLFVFGFTFALNSSAQSSKSCENAITLAAESIGLPTTMGGSPLKCPGSATTCNAPISFPTLTLGSQTCLNNQCNTGAASGPDFPGNNCYDFPGPTAWFQFTAPAGTATMQINVTGASFANPYLMVFGTTNCSTFTLYNDGGECYQGSGGAVSANMAIPPGTTLLIAVSGASGQSGNFNLCLTPQADASACNVNDVITVTATSMGSPLAGPYLPGETVSFCYNINEYRQANCNWLHGIVPTFGDCWDPSSFTAAGQPTQVTTSLQQAGSFCPGAWAWWADGVVTNGNPGPAVGAGWFFSNPAGANPNNSWGDGNGSCGAVGMGDCCSAMGDMGTTFPTGCDPLLTWQVCFNLTVRTDCENGTNCAVSMKTYADGQTGNWSNTGCVADLPTFFNAAAICCQMIVSAGSPQTICSNSGPINLGASVSNNEGPTTYQWSASPAGALAGISNPNILNPTFTPPPGITGPIVLTLTVTDENCSIANQVTITVTALPTAAIVYPATPYCSSITTAQPVNLTGTGNYLVGSYSATPGGLSINTTNGAINPSTSTPGTYTVSYTIPAAGGCPPVVAQTTVTITQNPTATIDYADPFCTSDVGTEPVIINGTGSFTGGGFAATGGLLIDASTGAITPSSVTGGSYTVTYTIPEFNGCPATPVQTTVVITPQPTALIDYADPFCTSLAGAQPVSLSGTGAFTGGNYSATPAGLTISASTGAITPSSSLPNDYEVTYTIPAVGGCDATPVTTNVTITLAPTATIDYDDPLCTSDVGTEPVIISGTGNYTGGSFGATGGLFINSSNGDITPSSVTGGSYTVTYTIPEFNGCPETSAQTTVVITTQPTAIINYADPFCASAGPQNVSISGTGLFSGGSYSVDPAGLTLNTSSGQINPSTSTPNTYTVTYTIPQVGGCDATPVQTTVVINPVPSFTLAGTSPTSCNGTDGFIVISGLTPGTEYSITYNDDAVPTGPIVATANGSGQITIPNLNAGTYDNVNVSFVSSGCGFTSPTTINLSNPGAPVLDDPADVVICSPDTYILPGITGDDLIGNEAYYTGPNGTGTQYLPGAVISTTTLLYVYATNGPCADQRNFTITVNTPPTANIIYNDHPFCANTAGSFPVELTGTNAYTGGSYSADPGLTINTTTGNVTPSTSSTGTFAVFYDIPSTGGCPAVQVSTSVTITPVPTAAISYAGPFCNSQGVQPVNLSGTNAYLGGEFSSSTGLAIDPVTGEIDAMASTPNTYTVVYAIPDGGGCPSTNVQTTVTINAGPTASISYSGHPFCNTVNTAQAVTLSGTGAFLGGSYSSDPVAGLTLNAANGNITPSTSTPGDYLVSYTIPASGGCPEGTASFTVTITENPTASLSYDTPFCSTDGAQAALFNGTGSYTGGGFASSGGLSLDAGTGEINPSLSTPNTYTVTYTIPEINGCASSQVSANLTITPAPTASIDYADPFCDNVGTNQGVTLNGTGTYLGGDFSADPIGLSLNTGNGSILPSSSAPGAYTVTYTTPEFNGCLPADWTTTVVINPTPVFTVSGTDPSACNLSDGFIEISGLAGSTGYTVTYTQNGLTQGPDNYTSDASGVITIPNLPAGNYGTFQVEANGCTGALAEVVTLINPGAPNIFSLASVVRCDEYTLPSIDGNNLSGNQAFYTAQGGLGSQYNPGDVITSSQTLYAYDITGSCWDEEPLVITINITPSLNNPGNQIACDSFELPVITGDNLSGGQAYLTPGGQPITGPITSSQTIFIYDQNGSCFDEVSFTVTINPSPVLVSISGGATYCAGADVADILVEVTGSPDYTLGYTLDGTAQTVASSNGTINLGNAAGTYVVTSLEDAGCTASVSGTQTIVVNPVPTAPIAGDDATYCYYDEFTPMYAQTTLNGTLTWYSDAGLSQQVGTGESLLPSSTVGTYTYYVVETAANCQGPSTLVTIVVEQCETEIPTAFTPDGDGVNDFWIIPDLSTNFPDNVVRVYNRWGNLIFESEGYATPWDGTYNGAELPVASYYFIVDFNDGGVTKPASGTVTIVRNK
jgi:gliding motility-associated-like protein